MRNPYEVLGIKEGAGEDEIKRAYRELVKKYHPDQYRSNPLSDLAEEKLREVNEAYDFLMKNNNFKTGRASYEGNPKWGAREDGDFYNRVRSLINTGNTAMAEEMLNSRSDRTAAWFYLKGLVALRKGWYDEAYANIQNAVNMDPGNYEYRDSLNRLIRANRSYRDYSYGRGYSQGPDLCTICQCLWCSDCCCECAGGDLISCC
ncbi:MAG: J domain-containing protein [Clostridia bacterium]|nr:J domain-containing protein [Clostridia bacterium]